MTVARWLKGLIALAVLVVVILAVGAYAALAPAWLEKLSVENWAWLLVVIGFLVAVAPAVLIRSEESRQKRAVTILRCLVAVTALALVVAAYYEHAWLQKSAIENWAWLLVVVALLVAVAPSLLLRGEEEHQERVRTILGWQIAVTAVALVVVIVYYEHTWLQKSAVGNRVWLLPVLALLVAAVGVGGIRRAKRRRECAPQSPADNGVYLGPPKTYDLRSLTLMLDEMQDQLKRLRGIDQKPLADSVGSIQVQRSTTLDVTVAASSAKPPAITGNSPGPKSDDEATAKKPAAAGSQAANAEAAHTSERSPDLLADQVNLTYDILNLRLLLERALSDRVWHGKARVQVVLGFVASINPPSFAVGCCATIKVKVKMAPPANPVARVGPDPGQISGPSLATGPRPSLATVPGPTGPRPTLAAGHGPPLATGHGPSGPGPALAAGPRPSFATGPGPTGPGPTGPGPSLATGLGPSLATGRAPLSPPNPRATKHEATLAAEHEPISIVALFPQERTYNTLLNRKHAEAINLGVPSLLDVVLRRRTQKEEALLGRDADVIAMIEPETDGVVTCGWQLRSGAGRTSVAAGIRQMFVVLALPANEFEAPMVERTTAPEIKLSVSAETYWRKFNPSAGVSSEHVGLRAWLSDRPVTWNSDEYTIPISRITKIEEDLQPFIDKITWYRVGASKAVVIVAGRNFFQGTSILFGDQSYGSSDGTLVIKSEQTLQLTVPLTALMTDGVLSGRYGRPVQLLVTPAETTDHLPELKIEDLRLSSPKGDWVELKIDFTPVDTTQPISAAQLPGTPDPLLFVNGELVAQQRYSVPGPALLRCTAMLPTKLVPNRNAWVLLKFPFLGPEWTFYYEIYSNPLQIKLTRRKKGDRIGLLLQGKDFNKHWKVNLDQEYCVDATNSGGVLRLLSPMLMELEVAAKLVQQHDNLVIVPPSERLPLVLAIPPDSATPRLSMPAKPPIVSRGKSAMIDIPGSHLDTIDSVKHADDSLPFSKMAGGEKLTVFVDSAHTQQVGKISLTLAGDDTTLEFMLFVAETMPT